MSECVPQGLIETNLLAVKIRRENIILQVIHGKSVFSTGKKGSPYTIERKEGTRKITIGWRRTVSLTKRSSQEGSQRICDYAGRRAVGKKDREKVRP